MRLIICLSIISLAWTLCLVRAAVPDAVTMSPTTEHPHMAKDTIHQREKKQMSHQTPVYFDTPPPQQQQPGMFPNIPIIGTLVGNIPGLQGQNGLLGGLTGPNGLLGGVTSQLGGGLNGLLGGLGGLTNIGGIFVPQQQSPVGTCPVSQKLSCRCEPLGPAGPKVERHVTDLEIVRQGSKRNADRSRELVAELSNGLTIYQKTDPNKGHEVVQGYYSLRLSDVEEKYLTIHYSANDMDYSVKADVTSHPPNNITL